VPAGRGDVVEITSAGLIVKLKALDTTAKAASVTVTVKLAVVALVGVPEMTPVAAASNSPAGKEPAVTDQVKGVVPPITARVVAYAAPFVPLWSGDVVEITRVGLIVKLKALDTVALAASVADRVKLAVAVAVGVPEMMPVAAASDSPAGKDPAAIDHVYGAVPPAPTSDVLYAVPLVPLGSDAALEMVSGPLTIKVKVLAALAVAASVTVAVKLAATGAVGEPEMMPVSEASVSPAGSDPDVIVHEYGVVPPLAASWAL